MNKMDGFNAKKSLKYLLIDAFIDQNKDKK